MNFRWDTGCAWYDIHSSHPCSKALRCLSAASDVVTTFRCGIAALQVVLTALNTFLSYWRFNPLLKNMRDETWIMNISSIMNFTLDAWVVVAIDVRSRLARKWMLRRWQWVGKKVGIINVGLSENISSYIWWFIIIDFPIKLPFSGIFPIFRHTHVAHVYKPKMFQYVWASMMAAHIRYNSLSLKMEANKSHGQHQLCNPRHTYLSV